MKYTDWKVFYGRILKDFNFDKNKDLESAKILEKILSKKNIIEIDLLKNLINKNNVIIFGAGPSLVNSIKKYKNKIDTFLVVSADGATSALLKNSIIPDIIVTDLDGKVSDQIKANKKGSIVLVHAHGDNIKRIQKYIDKFNGKIVGTTQTDPSKYKNLYNFGGFTDGDRCVFLADSFNAKKINLLGFDFNKKIGKYSFYENKDIKQKLKKLKWCKYLINELKKQNKKIGFE